jgi:vancomycin resistance protein YoaR
VRRLTILGVGALVILLAAGFAFAGNTKRLPSGTEIGGVGVGGDTSAEAIATLTAYNHALEQRPLTLVADGKRFTIRSDSLGFVPDWRSAVHAAFDRAGGPIPLRGYRRLWATVAGLDVRPSARYWSSAITYELNKVSRAVDHPRKESTLSLHGTQPVVQPGSIGRVLDRVAARAAIVAALTSFSRSPVTLPVVEDAPRVTAADLAPVAAQVRTALSRPVTLVLGPTRWRVPRWRMAQVLELPHDGSKELRVGGDAASAWLNALAKNVAHPAQDANFIPGANGSIHLTPAEPGEQLDGVASAGAILRAALSPVNRTARLVTRATQPRRSTAQAQTMGITGVVGSYETFYTGIPNRLHNVRLVAHLVDDKFIPPGAVFSFNQTTGDRNAAKGFLEAPVIINGELSTGLGGGVCQVSTTVFNAAYEGGLPIVERHNHALYISHYPQGRDATVNYPDVDLKFRNDTGHWLLLRMTIGDSSLVATLYGTPQHRKVDSITGPLVVNGPPPVKTVKDPTLPKGQQVIDDPGESSMSTQVERKVYAPGGKLLSDDVFHSYYVASPKIVRVGTKKPPKTTTTTTGTTTGTTTTGTGTTTTGATTTTPSGQKPPTD